MGMSRGRDLTEGNVFKLILEFSIPLLLGMLFQQFYSMVDTIIVGRYLGVKALAAVGSTGSINFMIIGFCMGVCNGFAIPIAQKFGAKKYKKLRKYVFNSAFLSAIFAIVMTVIARRQGLGLFVPYPLTTSSFLCIIFCFHIVLHKDNNSTTS